MLRWASITAVAERLELEQEEAEALAAELDEQDFASAAATASG